MPTSIPVPQATLAGTLLTSTVGSYFALTPPNPNPETTSPAKDFLSRLQLTNARVTKALMVPIGLLAVHTSSLSYLYPNIPTSVLRFGAENGLDRRLITWSPTTTVPLALLLCVGIPLRLGPYAELGKNFTFALAEPDSLTTSGLYRYVQHPSYTGIVTVLLCNLSLLARVRGALSCWIPPAWFQYCQVLEQVFAPVGVAAVLFAVWTRVREEERMLKAKFGSEWEVWHAKTARFIPWIF
ncbi:hypothetical protein F4808DRAFT_329254 [Astrocystis sublimbata]|nr:hypothetical protein F4808DRAFT_329254 [Astrocystis sublimbata]